MDTGKKLFSIIVPVYNVEDYLAQCLDSLLHQTYNAFEVILVDDVSTDGSRDIARTYVRRYPDQVRLIEHAVNTRQGGARNTGIEAATGAYLMFVDSDDYVKPETLQMVAEAFEAYQADIVEFSYEFVNEAGDFLSSSSFQLRIDALHGEIRPLLISAMGPCSKAYRAELFKKTDLRFPEKIYYEDFATVPKVLLQAGKVAYLEEPLYCYRQRAGSTIHDTNIGRNRDIMTVMEELLRYFKQENVSFARMEELEYLAIEQVLYHATLRVNSINPKSEIQRELRQFMLTNFPDYQNNPYWELLSARQKRLLHMIDRQQYGFVYLFWHCRNRMSGAVKRIIRTVAGEKILRRIG